MMLGRSLRAARLVALIVVATLAGPAAAAPHKVLVLPLDGSADAATRARLTTQVVRLARAIDGQVTTGDTTFADTALAVGCDPDEASCRDQVLATLAVDELVWGTATKDGAQTRLVVRRLTRDGAPRQVATTLATGDPADPAETGLAALFAPPAPPPPSAAPIAPPPPLAMPVTAPASHHDRNIGLVLTGTGVVALGVGLALWSSYSSLQDQIDGHPTASRADFDDLTSLEDRAQSRALAGDILVGAGVVAAGVGAYYLLRHDDERRIALVPSVLAHGGGVTLTIAGGL